MADYDLNKMEAAARAATPGPWVRDGHHMSRILKCVRERGDPEAKHICGDFIDVADAGENWMVDAPFIVEVNPAAILSLISDHRAALAEVERLRGLLSEAGKVLEPFAEEAETKGICKDNSHNWGTVAACTTGELRAARDLSTRIEKEIGNG